IYIEPFRSKAFPVIKDLVVDRSAFDRIQQSGGYVSVNTSGNTVDANTTPVDKDNADAAFDSATCIGCGACVAACKNASAALFVGAKLQQYARLPQGQVEATERAKNMVRQMDAEGFGSCTNTGACEIECPKGIKLTNIATMHREFIKSTTKTLSHFQFKINSPEFVMDSEFLFLFPPRCFLPMDIIMNPPWII